MTIEYLEIKLEQWKRWLLVCIGASVTLLVTGLDRETGFYFNSFWGWIVVWLILQLGTIPAGISLLVSSEWKKLPLTERLNTAFGFLAVSWLGWIALFIRGWGTPLMILMFFILPFGIGLAIIYWRLRRKSVDRLEELFP